MQCDVIFESMDCNEAAMVLHCSILYGVAEVQFIVFLIYFTSTELWLYEHICSAAVWKKPFIATWHI